MVGWTLYPPFIATCTLVRMDALRRLKRPRWLWAGRAALAVSLLGLVAGTLAIMLSDNLGRSDRIIAVAALVGGVGVLLGIIAGAVTLAAYADATRRPELSLTLGGQLSAEATGSIAFATRATASEPPLVAVVDQPFNPALLRVTVVNAADFPARNVSVRLEFRGLVLRQRQRDWLEIPARHSGDCALQWDGPICQGCWSRPLPPVNLAAAIIRRRSVELLSEVVAEEFRPSRQPACQPLALQDVGRRRLTPPEVRPPHSAPGPLGTSDGS